MEWIVDAIPFLVVFVVSFATFFVLDPFRIVEKVDERKVRDFQVKSGESAVEGKKIWCIVDGSNYEARFLVAKLALPMLRRANATVVICLLSNVSVDELKEVQSSFDFVLAFGTYESIAKVLCWGVKIPVATLVTGMQDPSPSPFEVLSMLIRRGFPSQDLEQKLVVEEETQQVHIVQWFGAIAEREAFLNNSLQFVERKFREKLVTLFVSQKSRHFEVNGETLKVPWLAICASAKHLATNWTLTVNFDSSAEENALIVVVPEHNCLDPKFAKLNVRNMQCPITVVHEGKTSSFQARNEKAILCF